MQPYQQPKNRPDDKPSEHTVKQCVAHATISTLVTRKGFASAVTIALDSTMYEHPKLGF
jgi:hypothetical protein